MNTRNNNDSREQDPKKKNNQDKEPQPRDTCFELGTNGNWEVCCCDDDGNNCECTGIV